MQRGSRMKQLFQGKSLIPKSWIHITGKYMQSAFTYIHKSASISTVFYLIRTVFYIFQLVFPFYCPIDALFWKEGRVTTQIIRFLSFFVYFGTIFEDISISFYINLGIQILIIVFNFILAEYFHAKGRFARTFMKFCLFVNECLMQVLFPWGYAQIAAALGKLINEGTDALSIVQVIVCFILGALILGLMYFYYYPSIIYYPNSSIFWLGNDEVTAMNTLNIFVFFGRLLCTFDGLTHTIIHAIYLVMQIVGVVLLFLTPLFIDTSTNKALRGFLIGSILASAVQFIRNFTEIDQDIVFILSGVFLVIGYFIGSFIQYRIILSNTIKCELLMDDQSLFETLVRTPIQFTNLVRIGFRNGHPYIFSWSPFKDAQQKWPNNKNISYQFLRFVAIYPEENITVLMILEEIKNKYKNNLFLKSVRRLGNSIIQSRNRHLSSSLKHDLKSIAESEKLLKGHTISYWSAVMENNSVAVYDIAQQILDLRSEIECQYMHLLNSFPNNAALCKTFARFLSDVEVDIKESRLWISKAAFVQKSSIILEDLANEMGRKRFPNIPEHLEAVENVADVVRQGASQASTFSAFSEVHDIDKLNENENNEEDMKVSINEMGLQAPLPFITSLQTFTFFFWLILIVVGGFIPPIIMLQSVQATYSVWDATKTSIDLGLVIMNCQYRLTHEAGTKDGTFFLFTEEAEKLNLTQTPIPTKTIITHFSNLLEGYIAKIATAEKSGDKWMDFFLTSVTFINPYTRDSYSMNLNQALNGLNGNQMESLKSATSYKDKVWFNYVEDNSMLTSEKVFDFVNILYEDITLSYKSAKDLYEILVVVLSIICILFIFIYAYLMLMLRNKWQTMVHAFSLLPRSSLLKCIQLFSKSSQKLSFDERVLNSDFIKMATARASYGGIPFIPMIVMFICQIVIAIVSYIIILASFNKLEYFNSIPKRAIAVGELIHVLYEASNDMLLGLASQNPATEFHNYDFATCLEMINEVEGELSKGIDQFVYGQASKETYGILSSDDKAIRESLFTSNGDTSKIKDAYKDLDKYILSLNDMQYLNELQLIFQSVFGSIRGKTLLKDDFLFLQLDHQIDKYITERIQDKYLEKYSEGIQSNREELELIYFFVPVALLVVGLVLMVFQFSMLGKLRSVAHCCLSQLRMVEPKTVISAQSIQNMLAGNFLPDSTKLEMKSTVTESVMDQSTDLILSLTTDMCISRSNQATETLWNLKNEDIQGTDFRLAFNIMDEKLNQQLCIDMNSKYKLPPKTFETDVMLVSEQRVVPVRMTTAQVLNSGAVIGMIVVMEDLSQEKETMRLIAEEKERSDDIIQKIIPATLVSSISKEKLLSSISKYIIVVVHPCNFDDIITLGQDKAQELLNNLREVIYLFNTNNCIHVKSVGISEIFLIKDKPDSTIIDLANDALKFIKNSHKVLSENGMIPRFGVSTDTQPVMMGLMSKLRVNFDVYGKAMNAAKLLANKAEKNGILVDRQLFGPFTTLLQTELSQRLVFYNHANIICYEYILESIPATIKFNEEAGKPEVAEETGAVANDSSTPAEPAVEAPTQNLADLIQVPTLP